MDRQAIQKQLDDNGYCVIPNVLSSKKCEQYLKDFQKWHGGFEENGERLNMKKSVIHSYRVGQFDVAWKCRLHCKPVFELLWGTEKLLTSVDGVALADPPKTDKGEFRKPGVYWLHLDQSVQRQGHHAYQGALYLEETTEKDYCFRVLKHSHKYHTQFFDKFPKGADKSRKLEFFKLNKTQRKWYDDQACPLVYVPVPKGGMVLWDSRTVHDTDPPTIDRPIKDKWRCVVFVSMTPAKWASDEDIAFKQQIYADLELTSHWSSQGQKSFKRYNPKKRKSDGVVIDTQTITETAPTAKTTAVKRMMGVEQYDFEDGKPNGPPAPTWIP